jgi:hypothetical protein
MPEWYKKHKADSQTMAPAHETSQKILQQARELGSQSARASWRRARHCSPYKRAVHGPVLH